MGISQEDWKRNIRSSDIRIQWDPEKDINGNDLPYRSIQLGLRGKAVDDYVHDWIVSITDITEYVSELNALRILNKDIREMLPKEDVYKIEGI